MKYTNFAKNPDYYAASRTEVDRQLHYGQFETARKLVKKWHKHKMLTDDQRLTLEQLIDRAELGVDKKENPGAFSWSKNAHGWALLYNGEVLARLSKNNEHSTYYSADITRGGNETFRAASLSAAKSKTISLARKTFPEVRDYQRSQPTVEYVNRTLNKAVIVAHGNVVRIEPVAFSTTLYRLTFTDGYTAESKIPKKGNPKTSKNPTEWVTFAQLNKLLDERGKGYRAIKLPSKPGMQYYGIKKHGQLIMSKSFPGEPMKVHGAGLITYLVLDGALSPIPNYRLDD